MQDYPIDHAALFNAMPFPRFIVKPVGAGSYILMDANIQAMDYFNRTNDAINKNIDFFFDNENMLFFQKSMEAALKTKKPVSIRSMPSLPSKVRIGGFWINPILDGDGNVKMLDLIALPLSTESSSLQRERDDAISLLTSIFDVSEVGIIVTDGHHRIIRINDSFVRIYGWKREDLIGRLFSDVIAPEERAMAMRNHEEFIESGIRSTGELKILRRDNNIANALYTTATLELSHGRRFQITTIMDITLRKQMEMTLRYAKEQADTANQAKSQFLANMSHELRTPLNAIIGFSEMMMKETFGPLGNDRYKEYLGDIHISARHLLEIINEVLDMSKIEAGRVELDEEYFSIEQLILAVSRMMASRAFSSGVTITEDVQDDLPPVYADSRLIRQVLINLVGNSVKFSKNNGEILIRSYLDENNDLMIEVQDHGVGIPKERIQEALEPFGQISGNAELHNNQGTGLGLPLAKAMVELHNGKLWLESDIGLGTTVYVKLSSDRIGIKDRKDPNLDGVKLAGRGE
jgi:two-component system cell cycle sensor histidine kinase PleC